MEATRRTQRATSGRRTSSNNHGNLHGNSQPTSAWSPPDRSLFKVNADASWNATTKKGNIAMVIKDSNDKFVAARKSCISVLSVRVAEAKAILDGCMLAKNLELDKIVMESDSKEMRWSWVPRSVNMVADRLASSKNSEMSDYTWVERPPYRSYFEQG
ncbi:uncharacterized protein [Pyrus communis]|uniref:uncharacterized protein n=1 Tax=Pyrus communis TaxID=23211 RepID=UPI0035C1286C